MKKLSRKVSKKFSLLNGSVDANDDQLIKINLLFSNCILLMIAIEQFELFYVVI